MLDTSAKKMKIYSPFDCYGEIAILSFWSLLICILMILYQVTKAFSQFRSIWIRFLNGDIEFNRIFCNVFSDEDEKPTWSQEDTQKLKVCQCTNQSTCTLNEECHQIPKWSFPIERIPYACKEEIQLIYRFKNNKFIQFILMVNTNQNGRNKLKDSSPES